MTLAFVPMHRGTKKPMRKDWNKRENCLFGDDALNQLAGCNAALALAYCDPPMSCLDIDDTTTALGILGLDPMSLDAPVCTSGKPNSLKVFFKLEGPFESIAVKHNGRVSFEYRCATKDGLTVPDCIPPSVHPQGTTYHWLNDIVLTGAPQMPEQLLNDRLMRIAERDARKHAIKPIRSFDFACDSPRNEALLRKLLDYINPDCDRDTWVQVIFAILSTGQTQAISIAQSWSEGAPDRFNVTDFNATINSYRPGHYSAGTLYYFAKQGGYRGSRN